MKKVMYLSVFAILPTYIGCTDLSGQSTVPPTPIQKENVKLKSDVAAGKEEIGNLIDSAKLLSQKKDKVVVKYLYRTKTIYKRDTIYLPFFSDVSDTTGYVADACDTVYIKVPVYIKSEPWWKKIFNKH